ncbi:hypothetical protein COLO4_27247 [Corchorus olitorius]|uniref:Uncharacterized protein n=1 Tax=Corchorus olitorius TaxID=93759 RepID=A0A1R3HRS3_9ROSI|nr:hypothetical protein COLO4_27247 [Corchorus olitorius]
MLYQACECELGCNCDELATMRWQVFFSLRYISFKGSNWELSA